MTQNRCALQSSDSTGLDIKRSTTTQRAARRRTACSPSTFLGTNPMAPTLPPYFTGGKKTGRKKVIWKNIDKCSLQRLSCGLLEVQSAPSRPLTIYVLNGSFLFRPILLMTTSFHRKSSYILCY